ncbi:hypothetical protein ACFORL_03005 [Legionella dresdenensis]|uniref:Uncharacterized protein n=1 Tax=Legionella dresdenensis TaxID=450200 RepID=A0ABV8CCK7_9GAMM
MKIEKIEVPRKWLFEKTFMQAYKNPDFANGQDKRVTVGELDMFAFNENSNEMTPVFFTRYNDGDSKTHFVSLAPAIEMLYISREQDNTFYFPNEDELAAADDVITVWKYSNENVNEDRAVLFETEEQAVEFDKIYTKKLNDSKPDAAPVVDSQETSEQDSLDMYFESEHYSKPISIYISQQTRKIFRKERSNFNHPQKKFITCDTIASVQSIMNFRSPDRTDWLKVTFPSGISKEDIDNYFPKTCQTYAIYMNRAQDGYKYPQKPDFFSSLFGCASRQERDEPEQITAAKMQSGQSSSI